jgi:ribosomal protein L11 methyltransferase
MGYCAYHFTVDPPQPGSEILMAMISEFGFESFDTNDAGFSAFIREERNNQVNLNDLVFDDFKFSFTIEKIEQTNWNAEWEKNFDPVVVDNLLCIRAPFHLENRAVKQEIIIMPKMSFGTGHHQTTRMMCAEMFQHEFFGKRVLDMGCGTGVLAILAKKLHAFEVVAIDIDEWSVDNSLENCAVNQCADVIVKLGDIDLLDTEKNFDFIIANINKNILKTHLKKYSEKMNPNAYLLMSGFFTTDTEELIRLASEINLIHVRTSSNEEWAMLVFSKNL